MMKAIFFDIDGTLVSFKTHTIPESTKEALLECKKKGILLFVATGRAKGGLEVLKDIPFDGFITLNGQYVYDKDGVLFENTIDEKELEIIKKEVMEKQIPCGFEMNSYKIYNYRDERVEELDALTHNDDQPAGDISKAHHVYQVQMFLNEQEEKEFMKKIPNCACARWYPTFIDILPLGGSKQKGMDIFAKKYGFTMSEAMAFGDGGNDRTMLEHAGIGIAMGNAVEELQQIADYVTESVDEDGIWAAMEHFHLI